MKKKLKMKFSPKSILIFIFLLQGFIVKSQEPFISDYWYTIPPLADSIAELELLATMGDSRWMHPKRLIAGDIRYAANDSILLMGGEDYLTAWESETGKLIWEYRFDHDKNRSNMIRSVMVCKSKPWVLAADDQNGLVIFNYYSGKKLKHFASKADFCYAEISADGRWVVLREHNQSWKIWEVESEKLVLSGVGALAATCFMPDGLTILISRMNEKGKFVLEAMDIQSGEAAKLAEVGTAPNFCSNLQLSADGKYLAVGFWGGSFSVLETDRWTTIYEAKIDESWVDNLSWSSDSKRLLVVGAKQLAIWEKRKKRHYLLEDCEHCVYEDGSWSDDNQHILLACREWQRPRRLRVDNLCEDLYPTESLPFAASHMGFSSDGKYLLAFKRNHGDILFWDWKKESILTCLEASKEIQGFKQARFSPKVDQLAALPYEYPLQKQQVLYSFPSLKPQNVSLKGENLMFMNGGETLVGIYFSEKSVFDYKFDVVHLSKRSSITATTIRKNFDQSSAYLSQALWGRHSANIPNWLNTKVKALLPGVASWHGPSSQMLCEHKFGGFSEDLNYYGGVGNDGILYIYDRKNGQPIAGKSLQGQDAWTTVISADGRYIAVASWDGLIRVYKRSN
jgi:WD40 repeat protein